jgi:hypothetical protein
MLWVWLETTSNAWNYCFGEIVAEVVNSRIMLLKYKISAEGLQKFHQPASAEQSVDDNRF